MQYWENIDKKYDLFIRFQKSMTIVWPFVWPIQKYDRYDLLDILNDA